MTSKPGQTWQQTERQSQPWQRREKISGPDSQPVFREYYSSMSGGGSIPSDEEYARRAVRSKASRYYDGFTP